MIGSNRKVEHPAFETIMDRGNGNVIVVFRVGYYMQPPEEARAAQLRILSALEKIASEDIAIFRQWSGSISVSRMNSKIENPKITEEMRESFRAAAVKAFPEFKLRNSWDNSMHGVDGFSVELG